MNRSTHDSVAFKRPLIFLASMAVTGSALGWLTTDPSGGRFSILRAAWFLVLLVITGLFTVLLDGALPAWSNHPRLRSATLFAFGFTLFRVGAAWINGNDLLEPLASGALSGAITGLIVSDPRFKRYLARLQKRRQS